MRLVTNAWTEITDGNVAAISFQNQSGYSVYIRGTLGTTPPTGTAGIEYGPGQGERNAALADLFPGVAGANRVWARAAGAGSALVWVSNA
ncbi:hypothetical protein G3572_03065 [Rhodobacter sp. ETT8]|uniref:Uncharacterized protein n=2 Tax=Pseudotabrizicola algicola TaxID=2709381 RepID=A0A6B3RIC6_9RHOB|nr:hypothetical protein [Pseudotabrizicola algicola]